MKMIVAVDKNWGIGKNNDLLVEYSGRHENVPYGDFRQGSCNGKGEFLESFPGGLPLKNRTNIVLSGNPDYQVKGAIVVHSLQELLEEIKKYPKDQVYCIGGDSVYKMLLPYCDTAQVTKIDFAYEADRYFPNLDEMPQWQVAAESEEQTYFDLEYRFVRYERCK